MISSAFAQSAAGGAGGFSLQGLLPFVLIFIIFYFLLIRPQQKRVKQHKLMVENLKRGNKVLTAGGILGVISKANEGSETVSIEISKDVIVDVGNWGTSGKSCLSPICPLGLQTSACHVRHGSAGK